ncbi:hypothetical protein [Flavobacterium sp. HJJ]|uniref:glycoside hydrolase family 78 protein n=1 Tax=Flavobacterium sp. HJJ TaxID=2783792 RepID=UPI00188D16AD|nr:hypothetical protein [Flavobacterium sp. HJJ]MBF4470144.1 hypothetical protein [Flavobacterium sp. HJJ]
MKQIKQFLILVLFVLSFIKITAANPNAPFNLRSFDKQNPIGTNDKPYFGWYVSDTDKNEIQSAYQIIVSSSLANLKADKGDVWDSKKTSSRK